MRGRQLSFLPPPRLDHGGDLRIGKRKLARPVDPKRPLHITMRAVQARGNWSMLHRKNKGRIFVLVHETAEEHGVKLHRFINVGNHLHLLVLAPSRKAFQAFLRIITGKITFLVTGTRKGKKLTKKFWDRLAYSRIVSWGREFRAIETYFVKNMLESLGIPRESFWIKLVAG